MKCFFVDTIHARSVCSSWPSTFPFPCCLLRRQSYSLYSFPRKDLCALEKIHLFLYRVQIQTFEYFLRGITIEEDHHTEILPSPLQCSVKANLPGCNPILRNMLDCQIIPLGDHYRIIGWYPDATTTRYKGVAFLQEGDEFFVLINHFGRSLVLRSSEMRWNWIWELSDVAPCKDLYTFRGKFYAIFSNGNISVIDPYNPMEPTPPLIPQNLNPSKYLIPSGDEEKLFLVEKTPGACRVSKLDEEAGEWIVVSDLGDRVLIIGPMGNVAFSGKDLPDGCGLSGNSILFSDVYDGDFAYKYGVKTGNPEDDGLGLWKYTRENRVLIHSKSPLVVGYPE